MISDSVANASIAMASSNFAKKKRVNRSAKLKQCKLDARREQWLSQVKNKGGCKVEVNGGQDERGVPSVDLNNPKGRPIEKLEIRPSGGEIYGDGMLMNHNSDNSEFSLSNSLTSHTSNLLGSDGSGIDFTASSRSNSSRSSQSSSSNGGSAESMSEEDEGHVDDDWEAVADALIAIDKKLQECEPESEFGAPVASEKHGNVLQPASHLDLNSESSGTVKCRAWRPDDAFRPQSLPNLSKQNSFPLNSEQHFGWGCKNVGPVPTSSCPICCEDLDGTDSSFLPCLCGFRLCLFCHKRILEQDGRCPGCRKQYESADPVKGVRLARSYSLMITRS